MRRIARKHLLKISRGGHVFLISFDSSSRSQLLDHLLDLADDRTCPVTWEDVFKAIDLVGAALRARPPRPSKSRL